MHYDFIEIGTCDFETLVERAPSQAVGLCIEPLQFYLDRLPVKPNVRKMCCAISPDGSAGRSDLYWVHPDDITRLGLPDWLRGCNRLGEMHPQHLNKDVAPVVRTQRVDIFPLRAVFVMNHVSSVQLLKLDTEGLDCAILLDFARWGEGMVKPQAIRAETNSLTPPHMVERVKATYAALGYKVLQEGHDLTLARQ